MEVTQKIIEGLAAKLGEIDGVTAPTEYPQGISTMPTIILYPGQFQQHQATFRGTVKSVSALPSRQIVGQVFCGRVGFDDFGKSVRAAMRLMDQVADKIREIAGEVLPGTDGYRIVISSDQPYTDSGLADQTFFGQDQQDVFVGFDFSVSVAQYD